MTPIITRAGGMELLRRAADSVQGGPGRILLISGETGIGKTWILNEFLNALPRDRLRAHAACDNLSSMRNFGPLFDMAEQLGESFSQDLARAVSGADPMGTAGQALLRLPPGTVLVFEDINDADIQTIDLLKYLFRRIGESRLLLVASFRPEALDQAHRLTGLLVECPVDQTEQFEVPALTRAEAAAMCNLRVERIEENFRLSGGNPLILSILQKKGFRDGDALPVAIERMAQIRLQRLSPTQRAWIELLAAVPPPHSAGLLGRLGREFNLDPRMVDATGSFLTRAANPEFRHEIMRQAVLASMPDVGRLDLQRRLMPLMQAWREDQTNPESFFKLALEIGDSPAITAIAIPAAKAAEARGDLNDCISYLTKALPHALSVDLAMHAQMSELWACRTAVREGISDRTIARIATNIEHWKDSEFTDAYGGSNLLLGRLLFYRGERDAALRYIEQAIETFDRLASPLNQVLALALAAEIAIGEGAIAKARQLSARIKSLVKLCKDKSADLELVLIRARLLAADGQSDQIWTMLDAAFDTATSNALHDTAARIQIAACDIALGGLDLDRAEAWASRRSGHLTSPLMNCWKSALFGRSALIALHRGETDRAAELAGIALAEVSPPPAFAFMARFANAIIATRGADPEAGTMLAECQKVAELIGDLDCRTAVNLAWIEYHYLAGRTDAARAAHAAALATVQKRSAERPVGGLLALWAFRLEDAAADAAAALPRPIALELTGDPDAAASAWLDAGHVFFAALARISPHGEGLQRRLQRSADEFAAMHATAALGLVRRTADSLGITLPNGGRKRGPYRAARSHPFGLTRREVEILRMIVDGDGNRDIADRLNRSLRTIEHHVSAILGKLGLESRVQAALFAISHRDVLEH